MQPKKPKPDIEILAYVAINGIQQFTDDNKQISRYVRSFRYEHHDALVMRRMAFNKLVDERESRLFGYDIFPEHQFRGLSLFVEYLQRIENGEPNSWELKKLHLLSGMPMSTEDQLVRWQKELGLLQKANPNVCYPVIPVESVASVYEILETPYWTQMYYFYEG